MVSLQPDPEGTPCRNGGGGGCRKKVCAEPSPALGTTRTTMCMPFTMCKSHCTSFYKCPKFKATLGCEGPHAMLNSQK